MTTKAGAALIAAADAVEDAQSAIDFIDTIRYQVAPETAIAAIEAEAAQAERERLRLAVEKMEHAPCAAFDYADVVDRAAVLRLLEDPK